MTSRRPQNSRGRNRSERSRDNHSYSSSASTVSSRSGIAQRDERDDRYGDRGGGRGSSRRSGGGRYLSGSSRGRGPRHGGGHTARLLEDNQLMCLIRALESEDDRDRCSAGLQTIEEFLHQPDATQTAQRAGETALVELADLRETFPSAMHERLAYCHGLAGALMDGLKFTQWILSRIRNTKLNDACRSWHLLSLQKAIETEHCLLVQNGMPALDELTSILENASSSVLTAVFGVLMAFSKVLPDVFRSRFRDFVDILVGCYVDPEQPEATIACAKDTLIALHPFWVQDVEFTKLMMLNLVEDVGLLSEKCIKDNIVELPTQLLEKMTAILRAVCAIASAVGTGYMPRQGGPVSASDVNELIDKILSCVSQLSQAIFFEQMLVATNDCFQVLAGCVQSYFAPSCVAVANFAVAQLDDPDSPPTLPQAISIVTMLLQIVEQVGSDMPAKFVSVLFAKMSPVLDLRKIVSPEVLLPLQNVFSTLLMSKDQSVVAAAYKAVCEDYALNLAIVQRHVRNKRSALATSLSISTSVAVTVGRRSRHVPLPTVEDLEHATPLTIETDSEEEDSATEKTNADRDNVEDIDTAAIGGGGGDVNENGDAPVGVHAAVRLCVFDLCALVTIASACQQSQAIVQALQPPLLEVLGLGSGQASAPSTAQTSSAEKPKLLLDLSVIYEFPDFHHMLVFVIYNHCKRMDFYLPVVRPQHAAPADPRASESATSDSAILPPGVVAVSDDAYPILQHPSPSSAPVLRTSIPPPMHPPSHHHPPPMGPLPPMSGPPPPHHPLHMPPPPFAPHAPPPPPPGHFHPGGAFFSPHFMPRPPAPPPYEQPFYPGPDMYGSGAAGIPPPPFVAPWGFPPHDQGMAWSDGYGPWDYDPFGSGGMYVGPDLLSPHLDAYPAGQQLLAESKHAVPGAVKSRVPQPGGGVAVSGGGGGVGGGGVQVVGVTAAPSSPALFCQFLDLLVELLQQPAAATDTRLLCLRWSRDLVRCLSLILNVFSRCLDLSSFVKALLKSCGSLEHSITIHAAHCLHLLFRAHVFPPMLLPEMLWTCVHHLGDANSNIRSAYTTLLHVLPVSFATRYNVALTGVTVGHTIMSSYLDILAPRYLQSYHHTAQQQQQQQQQLHGKHSLSLLAQSSDDMAADDINMGALDWFWRRATTARPFNGDFHSHHFRTIMAFVMHGITPLPHVNDDWLERIFYACKGTSSAAGSSSSNNAGGASVAGSCSGFDSNDSVDGKGGADLGRNGGDEKDLFAGDRASCVTDAMRWRWAMWQCAQYVVHSRLRTVLGTPQDTFKLLEGVLRELTAELAGSAKTSSASASADVPEGFQAGSGVGPRHYTCLLRVTLLLQFIDNLSKLMYNAEDGTAVALAPAAKIAKTFFRTNGLTCRTWLSRVRRMAAPIALRCGRPAAALHHGLKWLQQIVASSDSQHADLDLALSIVVQALIKLGSSDMIEGIIAWCAGSIGKSRASLRWMNAAALQARGRLEDAAHIYHQLLSSDCGASAESALPIAADMLLDNQRSTDREDSMGMNGDNDDSPAVAATDAAGGDDNLSAITITGPGTPISILNRRHANPAAPSGPTGSSSSPSSITIARRTTAMPAIPAKDYSAGSPTIALLSRDTGRPSPASSPLKAGSSPLAESLQQRNNAATPTATATASTAEASPGGWSAPVGGLIVNEAATCYSGLSEWHQVLEWFDNVDEACNTGRLPHGVTLRQKPDLVRALNHFESNNFDDAADSLGSLLGPNSGGGNNGSCGSIGELTECSRIGNCPGSTISSSSTGGGSGSVGNSFPPKLSPSTSRTSISIGELTPKALAVSDAESLCDILWDPDELYSSSQALAMRSYLSAWNLQLPTSPKKLFGSCMSVNSSASAMDDMFDDNASVRSSDSTRSVRSADCKSQSMVRRNIRQSAALLTSVLRVSVMDSVPSLPAMHLSQLQFVHTFQNIVSRGEQHALSEQLVDLKSLHHSCLQPGVHSMAVSTTLLRSAKSLHAFLSHHLQFFAALTSAATTSSSSSAAAATVDDGSSPAPLAPSGHALGCLRLEVARHARKLGNVKYARKLVIQQMQSDLDSDLDMPLLGAGVASYTSEDLFSIVKTAERRHVTVDSYPDTCKPVPFLLSFVCRREAAKLLYDTQMPAMAMGVMCEASLAVQRTIKAAKSSMLPSSLSTSPWLQSAAPLAPNNIMVSMKENLCRSFLTISKWLHSDVSFALQALTPSGDNTVSPLMTLVQQLPPLQQAEDSSMSSEEEACGRLLEAAVVQGSNIAKAWLALGAWCYKLGRRTVDQSSGGSVKLLASEESKVRALLAHLNDSDYRKVVSVIGHVHSAQAETDEDMEQENEDTNIELLARESIIPKLFDTLPHLRTTLSLAQLTGIVTIWSDVRDRVFSLYRRAVPAYFNFLRVGARSRATASSTSAPSANSRKVKRQYSESSHSSDVAATAAAAASTTGVTSSSSVAAATDPACVPTEAQQQQQQQPQVASDVFQTTTSTYSVDESTAVATLRLLRLLVKHASELQQDLEDGFNQTPALCWKGIIPQLFSRLNHPEANVRDTLCSLLCRLGQEAPQLVIYPAVVGAMSFSHRRPRHRTASDLITSVSKALSGISIKEDAILTSVTDEFTGTDRQAAHSSSASGGDGESSDLVLGECLQNIVSTFSSRQPGLVAQTRQFVSELLRISMLWPEACMQCLNHWQAHVTRCLSQLDSEAKRLIANETLTSEERVALQLRKHQAVLKLPLDALDHLLVELSRPAETRSEQLFVRTYGELLHAAVEALRSPENVMKPLSAWDACKEILQTLTQRSHKRSGNHLLLSDISPVLAHMRSAVVFLPNLASEASVKETSTLQWMEDMVHVLPTKTRPKKLSIMGTDGRRHTSLLKGTEDLHLDERIMQLLNMTNAIMCKSIKSDTSGFQARHYAVTPVGPKAGLIEWVDGATALFALYRRWQQREAQAAQMKVAPTTPTAGSAADKMEASATPAGDADPVHNGLKAATTTPTTTTTSTTTSSSTSATGAPAAPARPVQVTRPSELFFNKITPLLAAQGITDMNNRKEWPLSCLRKAYDQLSAETPSNLLEMEFWCSSSGSSEWWHLSQTYSRSLAVMSMIGYVIGLGDRHLDNVMVDLATGEVVHIDYNVCFEKGRGLRIPEKVPFRLTANLETALGLTGVEGTFRLSCERVLRLMKSGRETLLTLLEAFVYDPLVDWASSTSADGHAAASALALARGGPYRPPSTTANTNTNTNTNNASATSATAADKPLYPMSKAQRVLESEVRINTSLLVSRVAEVQMQWKQHCGVMDTVLRNSGAQLASLASVSGEITALTSQCSLLQRQQELFQAALTQPNHPLLSAHTRYAETKSLLDERARLVLLATDKMRECNEWSEQFRVAYEFLQSPEVQCGKAAVALERAVDIGASPHVPIVEFLVQAAQKSLVNQSEAAERDLVQAIHEQRSDATGLLTALLRYSDVVSKFPSQYVEEGRWSAWHSILERNLEDSSNTTVSRRHVPDLTALALLAVQHTTLHSRVSTARSRLAALQVRRDDLTMLATTELESVVTDSQICVSQILNDPPSSSSSDSASPLAAGVSAFVLADVSQQCLNLEEKAQVLGGSLASTYSSEGAWFLDDFVTVSTRFVGMVQLLQIDQSCAVGEMSQLCTAAKQINEAYTQLQGLVVTFESVLSTQIFDLISRRHGAFMSQVEAFCNLVEGVSVSDDVMEMDMTSLLETVVGHVEASESGVADENKVATVRAAVQTYKSKVNHLLFSNSATTHAPLAFLFSLYSDVETSVQEAVCVHSGMKGSVEVDVAEAGARLQPNSGAVGADLLSDLFYLNFCQAVAKVLRRCQLVETVLHTGISEDVGSSIAAAAPVQPSLMSQGLDMSEPVRTFVADAVLRRLAGVSSGVMANVVTSVLAACDHDVTAAGSDDDDSEPEQPLSLVERAEQVVASLGSGELMTKLLGAMTENDSSVRKLAVSRQLDQSGMSLRAQHQLALNQLLQFEWLHGESLVALRNSGLALQQQQQPGESLAALRNSLVVQQLQPDSRVSVIEDIKLHLSQLQHHRQTSLDRAVDVVTTLDTTMKARLRWASGSNPALSQKLLDFEADSQARLVIVEEEKRVIQRLADHCRSLVAMEALRGDTPETAVADVTIDVILDGLASNVGVLASVTRQQQVNATTVAVDDIVARAGWPNGTAGHPFQRDYLQSKLATLPQDMVAVQLQIRQLMSNGRKLLNQISNDGGHVEALLLSNKKLTSSSKQFLMALSRLSGQTSLAVVRRAGKFLNAHKSFAVVVSNASTAAGNIHAVADDSLLYAPTGDVETWPFSLSTQDISQLASAVGEACTLSQWLRTELLCFSEADNATAMRTSGQPCPTVEPELSPAQALPGVNGQRGVHVDPCVSAGNGVQADGHADQQGSAVPNTSRNSSSATVRDKRTGKALQSANSQGIEVLKRVRLKLEGRDADLSSRRLAAPEQVALLLLEATSKDNLCCMFEGWTGWV